MSTPVHSHAAASETVHVRPGPPDAYRSPADVDVDGSSRAARAELCGLSGEGGQRARPHLRLACIYTNQHYKHSQRSRAPRHSECRMPLAVWRCLKVCLRRCELTNTDEHGGVKDSYDTYTAMPYDTYTPGSWLADLS